MLFFLVINDICFCKFIVLYSIYFWGYIGKLESVENMK